MYIPRQAPSLPPAIVASLSGVKPNTAPTAQPSPVQQDYGKNTTNGVAIALPVVLGVGIILAITYFVSLPASYSSLFPPTLLHTFCS